MNNVKSITVINNTLWFHQVYPIENDNTNQSITAPTPSLTHSKKHCYNFNKKIKFNNAQ